MVVAETFPNREEWLKNRRCGIGGSDIAAVIGANPFMSNIDLWEIKTGKKEQADISENPRVAYGVQAESHLRALFALDHPEYIVSYDEFNSVHNDKYPWALASLDGATMETASGSRTSGISRATTRQTVRRPCAGGFRRSAASQT